MNDEKWTDAVRNITTPQGMTEEVYLNCINEHNNRVGENFHSHENFRPLTPPCVPFGTRRFNQFNK